MEGKRPSSVVRPTVTVNTMSAKRLNFSVLERTVLLRLIEENIDIVESKKNDSITVRQKDKAWARIVDGFNTERGVVRRSNRQLRKYWNNLKMRAKKSDGVALTLPRASSSTASQCSTGMVVHHHRAPSRTTAPSTKTSNPARCSATTSYQQLADSFIKDEPESSSASSFHFGGGDITDHPQPVHLEASLMGDDVDDEAEGYMGRSNGDDAGGGDVEEEEDIIQSDAEEMGEVFHCASENDFRHETAAGPPEGSTNDSSATNAGHWAAMDYARNEHEAKMALLTIQMETAHEQRELAREMREQTRQRHRLEMQVLEEKRRYRRLKMNSLPRHGGQS